MTARALNVVLSTAFVALGCWSGYLMVRLRNLEATGLSITRTTGEGEPSVTEAAANPPARGRADSAGLSGDVSRVTPSPEFPKQPTFNWSSLESEDYGAFIRNLRSIGCPDETIRDIVLADINKLYSKKRGQLITPETPGFWQAAPQLTSEQQLAQREELQNLDLERAGTIRRLLAVDPGIERLKENTGFTYTENRLGNLPREKQDLVSLVREEFNERWREIQAAATKGMSPDEASQQLRELDGTRLAKLREVLTPAEFAEHELQTSWTAIQLRQRLANINPSESEFRMLYEAQKPFDDEYVHYFNGRTDEVGLQRKQQEQTQLDERIRLILGEQRYRELIGANLRPVVITP